MDSGHARSGGNARQGDAPVVLNQICFHIEKILLPWSAHLVELAPGSAISLITHNRTAKAFRLPCLI